MTIFIQLLTLTPFYYYFFKQALITNGKAERVAKIALANKLLKQAFAIGKKKEKYREDFC